MYKAIRLSLTTVLLASLWLATTNSIHAGTINSIFRPQQFASLGTLNATGGTTINIDTDALTFDFGGLSAGVAATSQGGGVEMAVFTFDSIDIAAGVTINVTGNRGLVLASKGDFNFASTLSLVGGNGATAALTPAGGIGGSGAEDGVPGGSFNSSPPDSTHGQGGQGSSLAHDLSLGLGHGVGGGLQMNAPAGAGGAGGGGGYGGAGGMGSGYLSHGDGGANYGNDLLSELYGGSGGAGGRFDSPNSARGGGGGGGGAVELIAAGTLTVSGTVDVSGGTGGYGQNYLGGGGGSGGGIILAAPTLNVSGASILAKGGNASSTSPTQGGMAGGGGGGRIALYANAINGLPAATVDADGGAKGTGQYVAPGTDGSPGTFRYHSDGVGTQGELTYNLAPATIDETPTLEGYWKLDEPSGSVTVADSKDGHTGTVQNTGVSLGQPSAMSSLGTSAHFTRDDKGQIRVPYSAALNPEKLTLEAWVKADSLSGGGGVDYRSPVYSRGNSTGYTFYAANNNTWQYWVGTGTGWATVTGPSVEVDQWLHLVGTHDGTTQNFYINGNLVATRSSTYVPNPNGLFSIGSESSGAYYHFDGNIDNVAVLGESLGEQAISDHYNSFSRYASTVLADSPVGYWRLGEQSGTKANDAAGSRDGTYGGGVAIRQFDAALLRDVDTAASFQGTSDHVTIPYDAALHPDSLTVEAWAQVTGGEGTYRTVLSARDAGAGPTGYTIYANSGNQWEFRTGDGTGGWDILAGGDVVLGQWVHVVGTYDATTNLASLYLNGQLVNSATMAYAPLTTTSRSLFIGAGDDLGNNFLFDGLIDEVAIYSYAMSADDVLTHFTAGVPEPGSLTLAVLGLLGLAFVCRRRKR